MTPRHPPLDRTHAYLHAVIDSFSRRILPWRVADVFAPGSGVAVLLEASLRVASADATPVVLAPGALKPIDRRREGHAHQSTRPRDHRVLTAGPASKGPQRNT